MLFALQAVCQKETEKIKTLCTIRLSCKEVFLLEEKTHFVTVTGELFDLNYHTEQKSKQVCKQLISVTKGRDRQLN